MFTACLESSHVSVKCSVSDEKPHTGAAAREQPRDSPVCLQCRRPGFDPWRRKWQPAAVSLPGKSHGQRGLVGCSPCGCKELGTTERLTLTQETEEGRPGYRCAELGQSQPAAHSG